MAAHQRQPPRRLGLPLYAWFDDPEILYSRAKELGESAADAQGGLPDSAISAVLDALIEAAKLRGFTENVDGLRIRLSWAVRDARDARERAKRDTEREVRRAAIRAIVAGLGYQDILLASNEANQASGLLLPEADAETIARVEIAIEARRGACGCCSRAEARHGG